MLKIDMETKEQKLKEWIVESIKACNISNDNVLRQLAHNLLHDIILDAPEYNDVLRDELETTKEHLNTCIEFIRSTGFKCDNIIQEVTGGKS